MMRQEKRIADIRAELARHEIKLSQLSGLIDYDYVRLRKHFSRKVFPAGLLDRIEKVIPHHRSKRLVAVGQ